MSLKQDRILFFGAGVIGSAYAIKCVKVDVIEKLEPNNIYDYIFVPVRYEQAESELLAIKDNQSKNIITMTNNPKRYGYKSLFEFSKEGWCNYHPIKTMFRLRQRRKITILGG